jgi:hypothetical protein
MKIWKLSGIFLIVTGWLHTIVALFLGGNEFLKMIKEGVINTVGYDTGRHFVFWFFTWGIVIIFFGHLLHYYIKKEQKPAPRFLGYFLLRLKKPPPVAVVMY